jgi:Gpi18-like mannosyltransferase
LFLLLFPTSFFFGAVYTEGFFFFLVVSTFYFLAKKNYGRAGFTAFLASLTRINGILLVIPFFLEFIKNLKKNKNLWLLGFTLLTSFFRASNLYAFLLKTTGDALAFFHAQTVFAKAAPQN